MNNTYIKLLRALSLCLVSFICLTVAGAVSPTNGGTYRIKNVRNGRYLGMNSSGFFSTTGTVSDQTLWTISLSGASISFKNVATSKYIGTPAKNENDANVTTSSSSVLYTLATGTYNSQSCYQFKYSGGQYSLNMSPDGSKFVIYTSGDAGAWFVFESNDSGNGGGTTVAPTTGTYYRIRNAQHDSKYLSEDQLTKTAVGTDRATGNYTQLWQLVSGTSGRYYLQNCLTDDYLVATRTMYQQWTTSTAKSSASQFTIAVHSAVSSGSQTYYTIVSSDGATTHLQQSGYQIVSWDASSELSASDWQFETVGAAEQAGIEAARQEYQGSKELDSEANRRAFRALFADDACTQMASGVTSYNLTSNSNYNALPQVLKNIAMKVASGNWAAYERTFRIADYHVYSDHSAMREVVRVSNIFGQLSNPTGISVHAGDVVCVMVGNYSQIPSTAEVKMEFVRPSRSELNATGSQVALHEGLNVISAPFDAQLYVFYEIKGATNSSAYYLSNFPVLPIHIEGGYVNGYFDLTRGMTDSDWTGMLNAGLFSDERLQLKGRHVLYNWPSSEVKANNYSEISSLINYWDDLCRIENELMGLYQYDAAECDKYYPGQNLTRRFNNIYNATGGDVGGNPHASSYGGYFPGDLSRLSRRASMYNSGGTMWTAGHEMGHLHQSAFNMLGMSEISNNIFSNVVLYELTTSTSRGDALRTIQDQYVRKHHWLEYAIDTENTRDTGTSTRGRYDSENKLHIGWWCHTQLYWKLYEYFHIAGRDTRFYQKLFANLRANPLNHSNNVAVPASEDYLRFAEACCQASGQNLSEFFELYGFFRLFSESDYYFNGEHLKSKNDARGVSRQCVHIDDYANYYVYVTQAMIDATKAHMAAYGEPVKGIIFIDDRFPAKAKDGVTDRVIFSNEFKFYSEGDEGCSVANYQAGTKCGAYSATFTKNSDGSVNVVMDGSGAAGFVVRSANGTILYVSAFSRFTIPAAVANQAGGADALINAMRNNDQLKVATVNNRELSLGEAEEQTTPTEPPTEPQTIQLTAYKLNVERGYLPGTTSTYGSYIKSTTEALAGRYAMLQKPAENADGTKEYYLYCIDNQRFIQSTDFNNTNGFLDRPDGSFTITPIGTTGKYIIASKSSGHYLQFGGGEQLLVNDWATLDEGNQWMITEAGQFDAAYVYDLLGWEIPASIQGVSPSATSKSVYNLNGQQVALPKRGLYIVNGKKTMIR